MRTGSTALENILRALLPRSRIWRRHPRPNSFQFHLDRHENGRLVATSASFIISSIRHPLDSLLSHMLLQNLSLSRPADNIVMRRGFDRRWLKERVRHYLIHGGMAVLQLAEAYNLSAAKMMAPDVLLLNYTSLSNGSLHATINQIAAFVDCRLDALTADNISNRYNISAMETYLHERFTARNVTGFQNFDPETRMHAGHIGALHGQSDYRQHLSPAVIEQVYNSSHALRRLAILFWPERTALEYPHNGVWTLGLSSEARHR